MLKGTIKFFLPDKQYGFITPQDGVQNIYFHQDQLEETVREGDQVLYELQEERQGAVAIHISLQSDSMPGNVNTMPDQ